MTMPNSPLKYLGGYPQHVQARVRELIVQDRLDALLTAMPMRCATTASSMPTSRR